MNINGFKLPSELEANLHNDRYKLSDEQTARLKVALSWINNPAPLLFDCDEILKENRFWSREYAKFYLGKESLRYPPGNIDPKRALTIGEAEPDSPIVLDYRVTEPRVIYLCDIDHISYWVELSSSYATLMETIGVARVL